MSAEGNLRAAAPTTSETVRHKDLQPNPLNPRRIFDKYKLDVLEESIRANGILVPLTVYRNREDKNRLYILDGERRWRCAVRIEHGEVSVGLSTVPKAVAGQIAKDSSLTFDAATKILIHRRPCDAGRREQLLALSDNRDWRDAIEQLYAMSRQRPPKMVPIPVNVVDPPTPAANMLFMFHTHNLREQWELMPTALSLQVLMKDLHEEDPRKLAELTKLSERNVERCLVLLGYPRKYQRMMVDPDPDRRLKANLFIEMHPILDLYEGLGRAVTAGKSREKLIDTFIEKYKSHQIASVIHFRRILEARDLLEEGDRLDEFKFAARRLVVDRASTIRGLFDPLTAEDRKAQDAATLCKDFIGRLRKLNVRHTTRGRATLAKALRTVQLEVEALVASLSDAE